MGRMVARCWVRVLALVVSGFEPTSSAPTTLPLLLPDPHLATRLTLQPEAVSWLRTLRGPIALVSAIGPYRSGKSFLLNQLSRQRCAKGSTPAAPSPASPRASATSRSSGGFEVGHHRDTQTKGVWLSTEVRVLSRAGRENVSGVYLDTEGFDATGKVQ